MIKYHVSFSVEFGRGQLPNCPCIASSVDIFVRNKLVQAEMPKARFQNQMITYSQVLFIAHIFGSKLRWYDRLATSRLLANMIVAAPSHALAALYKGTIPDFLYLKSESITLLLLFSLSSFSITNLIVGKPFLKFRWSFSLLLSCRLTVQRLTIRIRSVFDFISSPQSHYYIFL